MSISMVAAVSPSRWMSISTAEKRIHPPAQLGLGGTRGAAAQPGLGEGSDALGEPHRLREALGRGEAPDALAVTGGHLGRGSVERLTFEHAVAGLRPCAEIRDLAAPPGNRLEQLRGDLAGFYGIRVNDQFRIIFKFEAGNASHVQLIDYH